VAKNAAIGGATGVLWVSKEEGRKVGGLRKELIVDGWSAGWRG